MLPVWVAESYANPAISLPTFHGGRSTTELHPPPDAPPLWRGISVIAVVPVTHKVAERIDSISSETKQVQPQYLVQIICIAVQVPPRLSPITKQLSFADSAPLADLLSPPTPQHIDSHTGCR